MTTKIEWVRNPDGTKGETWNPCTGCNKVSAGCAHCYAERMARRLAGRYGYPPAPHHFDVTLRCDRLEQPLRWKKPRRIFVCSMGDLFHEDVLPWFICEVWQVMRECPQHIFQILTKRPRQMRRLIRTYIADHELGIEPLPNVWLGVTAENQATADERREYLRQCPATVKFVSYEPALEPVDWAGWEFVDQIISGGESGPGARPSHPDWHRATRDFCQANEIAYFFKSWGQFVPECHWRQLTMKQRNRKGTVHSFRDKRFPLDQRMYSVGKRAAGRLLDGRTWDEFPKET